MSAENLGPLVREVVQYLVSKYQWKLLTEEEFIRLTALLAQDMELYSEEEIKGAAINAYCQVWYAVCKGEHSLWDSESGYSELFEYLFNVARSKYHLEHDNAQEVAQEATVRVYRAIDKCKIPSAFMRFCLWKLKDAYDTWRYSGGKINPPEYPIPSPTEHVLCADLTERVVKRFIAICVENSEQGKRLNHLLVVAATVFMEMTYDEIVAAGFFPKTSKNTLYSWYKRGVELLAKEYLDFLELVAEMVETCK